MYDWLFSRTRAGAARGFERARRLLDLLGGPDRAFRSVRVVGTNGKGSTCAMLEAGLIAAGQTVGRFTSPHLQRFEERVRVNGREIEPRQTGEFVAWARERAPDAPFFELALGLACQSFREAKVGWGVMEAGVGGESDATQALENVALVLLTNVALDHTATLGGTVGEIARDKAGAAKANVPLLTTAAGEALEVIREVAAHRGAPVLTPQTHPDLFELPHPPRLEGAHQAQNARLALAALRLLNLDRGAEAALGAAHPGRLERFAVEGREVVLDGAHNPHAARALAKTVGEADTLLFGAFNRKAVEDTLAPLLKQVRRVVFTFPGENGADPRELAAAHGGFAEPHPAAALRRALDLTPPGGRLLVAGSLYLVGEVRGELMRAHRASGA